MLYAITDRRLYGSNEAARRHRLLELTAIWAAHRVAFIQLREKDLSSRELVELARAMLAILRPTGQPSHTRLLLNNRPDVALAIGADGIHLPSGAENLTPDEVRSIYAAKSAPAPSIRPFIGVSCHNLEELTAARRQQADAILFAPVFEKKMGEETLPGVGLDRLAQACRVAHPIPVFALGGITTENAPQCLAAGASGIAAIRLMTEPPRAWRNLVSPLDSFPVQE